MRLAAALLVLVPRLALAAADAHHESAAPTFAQWKLLGFATVNFAIFVGLMIYLARAPLRDFLKSRRKGVLAEMEEARRLKQEAEQLLREVETRAEQLEQARADLIAEVRSIAEADREKAVEQASESAERMKRDAERTAQSDLSRAKEELRAEAARLAAELAAAEVRRRLTDEDRGRLLKEFLTGVTKQ